MGMKDEDLAGLSDEERAALEDDDDESDAVRDPPYLAGPLPPSGIYRHIRDREPRAEKGHCDGCWVGEPVWEKIKKLSKVPPAHCPKSRGQICDLMARHPGRHPIVNGVRHATSLRSLRLDTTRAD